MKTEIEQLIEKYEGMSHDLEAKAFKYRDRGITYTQLTTASQTYELVIIDLKNALNQTKEG
jgi:hypothetical protein